MMTRRLETTLSNDYRKISIALVDPDFGEEKAHACANAWSRHSSFLQVRCCIMKTQLSHQERM